MGSAPEAARQGKCWLPAPDRVVPLLSWSTGIGSGFLASSERAIHEQVEVPLSTTIHRNVDIQTFKDEARAGRVVVPSLQALWTLGKRWALVTEVGYSQGALRQHVHSDKSFGAPLLPSFNTGPLDARFVQERKYAAIGVGPQYYPFGREGVVVPGIYGIANYAWASSRFTSDVTFHGVPGVVPAKEIHEEERNWGSGPGYRIGANVAVALAGATDLVVDVGWNQIAFPGRPGKPRFDFENVTFILGVQISLPSGNRSKPRRTLF